MMEMDNLPRSSSSSARLLYHVQESSNTARSRQSPFEIQLHFVLELIKLPISSRESEHTSASQRCNA